MSDEPEQAPSDFDLFLQEMGLTHEDMEDARRRVTYAAMTPLERGVIYIKDSDIEGQGVFAKGPIVVGAQVCPVMSDIYWSIVGRYMNHSATPNVDVKKIAGSAWFIALSDIAADAELTVNYRRVREVLS